MNQKLHTQDLLIFLQWHPGSNITRLAEHFWVSNRTIHRHIKILVSKWSVQKKGKTPYVQYYPQNTQQTQQVSFDASTTRLLDQERYQIEKDGKELVGSSWFVQRCKKRDIDPQTASVRRAQHVAYVDSLTTSTGIDATHKLYDYPWQYLQKLLYGHIYALPEFGKTKYGTWMEIAKTYPSIDVFDELFGSITNYLTHIVDIYNIDAICFAKPTASRMIQIMWYAEKVLLYWLPRIKIQKAPGYFPAQKTLKKREERIANAQASFEVLPWQEKYSNVLIIDDAVWSGATLVEIANKILEAWFGENIFWFSMVGTANWIFDEVKHFEVLASV